jgi:hypothetical protein
MEKIDLKYEIISTLVLFIIITLITLILLKFDVEKNVIWLAEIIIGIEALMLVGMKFYFFKQKADLKNSINELIVDFSGRAGNIINPMFNKLSTMDKDKQGHANKIISDAAQRVEEIANGIIYLNEPEYFNEIISEIERMSQNETILAVNAFDARRFIYDPREIRYFNKNKEAICNRNIKIDRIFINNEMQSDMNIRKEKLFAIKNNLDAGIDIYVVYKSQMDNLRNANELCEDAVLFGHDSPRLYIDYQDKIDETRISHGELRINSPAIERFKVNINTLKNMAISKQDILDLFVKVGL